ncbi:MAG: hypothetical protein JWM25_76, partial [Thermoleophilia bacterium]|nr:hypothetical protein [Thermoleophilia bacterium]
MLLLISIPVLANGAGSKAKPASPAKATKPAACSTKSAAYRAAKPVKRGSKAKPVKPPRVCRTPLPPSAKFLPSFVPSTVAAELGKREKNGGQHGWAKLGASLGSTSSFTGPKGKVGVRLLGAPSATRTDFENGAAYVTKSYTAVQVFEGTSFKESIVVPKRLGARNWSWKLTLPKGRVPTVLANGGVDLGVGLFIPAPVITRADGTTIKTGSAWAVRADGTLTLRLNDKSFPTPYIIDPGVVPEVAFTGFSGVSANTYIDPAYALTRIYYNASQSGTFTANAAVHDPDTATPVDVCYPAYGAGWTSDGGCVPGSAGVPQGGILATYYSGSTSGSTYPGSAFTTNNNGANCANNSAGAVGPFSRIEQGINSYSNWGTAGVNDDAPYAELCPDSFSGRWRGAIRTGATGGMHLFGAISDDGIRVTINGTRILSEWSEHTPAWHTSCPITLTANTTYPIEVEYFENNSSNRAQLRWWTLGSGNGPGGTANCLNPGDPIRTWIRTTAAGSTPWAPINETGVNATNGTAPTNWPIIPAGSTTTPGLHMPSNTFARTYSWTPTAAAPSPVTQNIVARDEDPDPDPGTTPFTAIADGVGPTGGTISISAPLNGGTYAA